MSPGRPPRYEVVAGDGVIDDVVALAVHGPDLLAAAEAAIDDLAYGRVVGKLLGVRRVSGDLTGLARIKFDVEGERPQRFRLLYRPLDDTTYEILAIGLRDEHAIYKAAVDRLAASRSQPDDAPPTADQ